MRPLSGEHRAACGWMSLLGHEPGTVQLLAGIIGQSQEYKWSDRGFSCLDLPDRFFYKGCMRPVAGVCAGRQLVAQCVGQILVNLAERCEGFRSQVEPLQ